MPQAVRATTVVNNYVRQLAKENFASGHFDSSQPLTSGHTDEAGRKSVDGRGSLPEEGGTGTAMLPIKEGGGFVDKSGGFVDMVAGEVGGEPRRQSILDVLTSAEEPGGPQYIHAALWFKTTIASCVVGNAIQLGMELDYPQYKWLYYYLDHTFTGIFTAEMIVKFKELCCGYFKEGWNLLDFSLVTLSILDVWAMPLYFALSGGDGESGDLRMFSVLRILRVLRVVRAVRLLRVFQELWKIVRGIMDSVRTIFWASLLLVFLLYICGIFCCAMVGKNEEVGYLQPEPEEVQEYGADFDAYQHFGTVPRSMFTLFETTIEPLNIRPVVERQPAMLIFFIGFIFLTTFGVLNVIIGVIVDHTMAVNDEETQQEEIRLFQEKMDKLEVVREMCFDDDNNGELSVDELQTCLESSEVQATFEDVGMPLGLSAEEFFTLLDDLGDGKVTHQKMMMSLTRAAVHTDHQQLLDLKIANHTTQRTLYNLVKVVEDLKEQVTGQLAFGFGTVLPEVVKRNGDMPEGLMKGMELAGLLPEKSVKAHVNECLGRSKSSGGWVASPREAEGNRRAKLATAGSKDGIPSVSFADIKEPMSSDSNFQRSLPSHVQLRPASAESLEQASSDSTNFMQRPVPPVGPPPILDPAGTATSKQVSTSPNPHTPSDVSLFHKTIDSGTPVIREKEASSTLPPINEPATDWQKLPQNMPGWAGTPQSLPPGPPANFVNGPSPTGAATESPSSEWQSSTWPPPTDSKGGEQRPSAPPFPQHPSAPSPRSPLPQMPSRPVSASRRGDPSGDTDLSFFTHSPSQPPTPTKPPTPQATGQVAKQHSAKGQSKSQLDLEANLQSKPNELECPELTPQPGASLQPGASEKAVNLS